MNTNKAQVSGSPSSSDTSKPSPASKASNGALVLGALTKRDEHVESDSDSTLHGDLGASSGFVDVTHVVSCSTNTPDFKLNCPCINFPVPLSPNLYRTGDGVFTENDDDEEEYSDDSLSESPTKEAHVSRRLEELAATWDQDTLLEVDSLLGDNFELPEPSLVLDSLEPAASEPIRLMNELRILQQEMKQLTSDLNEDTHTVIKKAVILLLGSTTSVLTPVPEIDELPTPVNALLPAPKANLAIRTSSVFSSRSSDMPSPPLGAKCMWIPALSPSPQSSLPQLRSSITSSRTSLKSSRATSPRVDAVPKQACQAPKVLSPVKTKVLGALSTNVQSPLKKRTENLKRLNLVKVLPDKAEGRSSMEPASAFISFLYFYF